MNITNYCKRIHTFRNFELCALRAHSQPLKSQSIHLLRIKVISHRIVTNKNANKFSLFSFFFFGLWISMCFLFVQSFQLIDCNSFEAFRWGCERAISKTIKKIRKLNSKRKRRKKSALKGKDINGVSTKLSEWKKV